MEVKIAWGIISLAAAAMTALLGAYAAHDLLGMSRRTIETDALCCAAVTGGLLIIFLLRDRFGRRR